MANKTDTAIVNSLKELMQEKSLNKITVGDIADNCGINRMTFYYHFHDMGDLIRYILNTEGQIDYFTQMATVTNWVEVGKQLAVKLKEMKPFIMYCFSSNYKENVTDYLNAVFVEQSVSILNSAPGQELLRMDDRETIIQLYSAMWVRMLITWIADGMNDDMDKILDRVGVMLTGTIPIIVERCLESYAPEEKGQ